jgi:secreted trypsin-like serine protease
VKSAIFLVACALGGQVNAAEPFDISVTQRNALTLTANGRPPAVTSGSTRLANSIGGTEDSQCTPYGRVSDANGVADVTVVDRRADGLTLELTGNSAAYGGHYRNCVQCILNQCLGVLPQDTTATALSQAGATVAFKFATSVDEGPYILDVGVANRGAAAVLTVTDQSGNPVSAAGAKGAYAITARPGSNFYVNVTLDTRAQNQGMGGSDIAANASRIDLRLRRAPLLTANRGYAPFIKGGKQTSSYLNVGAVLIDSVLHCTASVVGRRTLLTAAHCIAGYENQLQNFTFLVGPNIVQPTFGPVRVTGFAYPDGSDASFKFERATLKDDIALLYLESDAAAKAVELHTGQPTWDDVLAKRTNLTFVGFGFDVIQGEQLSSDIKREASWYINAVESRRVLFSVPKTSTCKGDSGGPAFLIGDGKIIQVAITSGGESDCSAGFETRIDSYLPWLAGRIR